MIYTALVYCSALVVLTAIAAFAFRLTVQQTAWSVGLGFLIVAVAFPTTLIGVASGSAFVAALMIAATEEIIRGAVALKSPSRPRLLQRSFYISLPFAFAETSNWPAGEKAREALADLGLQGYWYTLLDYAYIAGEFLAGLVINAIFAALWLLVLRDSPNRFALAFILPFALHFILDYFAIGAGS